MNTMKINSRLYAINSDLKHKINSGNFGRLSLFDIKTAMEAGKNLLKSGTFETFNKNVADYFKFFGCYVTMDFNNVNYIIVA